MPTYVYKFVETGETIEVQQAFTDDSLTEYAHPDSGDLMAVKKVFQPVGVTFKGDGFFKTDSRKDKKSSTKKSDTASIPPDTSSSKDSSSKESSSATKDSSSKGSSSSTTSAGSSSTSTSSTSD